MTRFQPWQSGTALFTALALTVGAVAPLVTSISVQAQTAQTQTRFTDLASDYWAKDFIQGLANRGIISGFPDGSFRPDEPVTRAQFAALIRQAFRRATVREPIKFVDVPDTYWAIAAIREAYATGFMSGYPENDFRPDENIPRVQVLVSLSNGLQYTPTGSADSTLKIYTDARAIPDWARPSVAAATQKRIVVNYPDPEFLQPERPATRAEVAAFIYQALVSAGEIAAIPSRYVVGQVTEPSGGTPSPTSVQIPAGTTIPTRYSNAEKIYLSLNEPKPVPVTLNIPRNVIAQNGRVLIPAGSEVVGELEIVDKKGAQFRAQEIVLVDHTRLPIDATSSLVTNTEVVSRSANPIEALGGIALGSGAAAAIAAVTGDHRVDALEVLGGSAAGFLTGLLLGRSEVTLVSIDPETDLDLTLNRPLVIR